MGTKALLWHSLCRWSRLQKTSYRADALQIQPLALGKGPLETPQLSSPEERLWLGPDLTEEAEG